MEASNAARSLLQPLEDLCGRHGHIQQSGAAVAAVNDDYQGSLPGQLVGNLRIDPGRFQLLPRSSDLDKALKLLAVAVQSAL